MSMKFNQGGYDPATSDLGAQINDKFWSKVSIKEARKKRFFSQLGDKLTQPKNYGDKMVKYHELPIIHELNKNDQGIDANGAVLIKDKWFAYDTSGAMVGSAAGYATSELAYDQIRTWVGLDVTGAEFNNTGANYATEALAVAAATAGAGGAPYTAYPIVAGTVLSGNGNIYGGDTDFSIVKGSFPSLREEGGIVNAVGMTRLTIEAQVEEFGFHVPFTKKMLEMDTETGLLARISREVGEAQGTIREMQIQAGLLTASEVNRFQAGDASNINEIGAGDVLTFTDIRAMEQGLKAAKSPKQTKIIDGSTKVGTTVIGAGYTAYVGQELYPTLEDMTHNSVNVWKPIETYAAAGMIMEGEIGKISATRFIEVEDMISYKGAGANVSDSSDDTGATDRHQTNGHYDVFPVLYVGTDSFATIGFEGDVARVETIMPKADAYNDVFGKKGAVAISWYFGMMIYRPERIRQIICSAKLA